MRRVITSVTLVCIVMLALGIPFTKWGFKTDDWANIFHSKLQSWQECLALFSEGNMESINHASGAPPDRGSFLSGLYRPLSFIYYYPQTLFFKTNAYGYFLTTIFFHACNTALFFLFLSYFFSFSIALVGALFFGFHPSLQNWLGWISAQTYFIELFVLSFIFLFFYLWLTKKHTKWYILSLILFFSNLLLKEACIVLPCWIFITTYLYFSSGKIYSRLKTASLAASGYLLTAVAYLAIRINCMPFSHEVGTLGFQLTWKSFIEKQISRSMQFLTYTYDILGLTWLPKGQRLINGFLLIFLLLIFFILFLKNKNKKDILFCVYSTIVFSWPGLIMHYQPRYSYLALPWIIVTVLLLITTSTKKHYQSLLLLIGLLISSASALYIFKKMKQRETALHHIDSSLKTLVFKTLPQEGWNNEPLYFFGLPQHWFDMGTAQSVWFLKNNASFPVYQKDNSICMPSNNHPWAIPLSNSTEITIHQSGNKLRLQSSDKAQFAIKQLYDDHTIEIEPAIIKNGGWLISWDYQKACFKIIGKINAAE